MKKTVSKKWIISIVFLTLFLSGCQKEKKEQDPAESKTTSFEEMKLPYEEFRKIGGWFTSEDVVVQTGSEDGDSLSLFNVLTGEMKEIFKTDAYILSVAISPKDQKIIFQQVKDSASTLICINAEGKQLEELPIDANGYVSLDWNKEDPSQVFTSYYEDEEQLKLLHWNMSENKVEERETTSLYPVWYSENLYLYVDNKEDYSLETGQLYMGDVRSKDPVLINDQVADFFLHEDTFITFTSSDFNKEELLLTYQYPFMVENGFLTIPKVTMNGRVTFPYLTQAGRDTLVYGIFAKEPVEMEKETGEFQFGYLDFNKKEVVSVTDVPDDAPVQLSPNGKYSLYGWRSEYLIDIESGTVHSLLDIPDSLQS